MPFPALALSSPAVARALDVLGCNTARLAVLGYLTDHPGSTVSEIADGTALPLGTVKTHVAALIVHGVLDPDPASTVPYELRSARRTRYTIHHAQLREHHHHLTQLLRLTPARPEPSRST